MNILLTSVGKHAKLVKDIKNTLSSYNDNSKIIVTSNKELLPSLYLADKYYITEDVKSDEYIDNLIEICKEEKIDALMTMLDLETIILSKNKKKFENIGVKLLVPEEESAKLCFDKYLMYQYLKTTDILTMKSFDNMNEFKLAYRNKEIEFPVFVKPRSGRGSVGARKVGEVSELKLIMRENKSLIIQEYIKGKELDIDVYVDYFTGEPVSLFIKEKILAGIGGTQQAISYKNSELIELVKKIIAEFSFKGVVNIELMEVNNNYYLIEINPRLSAAYIHAYACGVDFIKLIKNNVDERTNKKIFDNYDSGIFMMHYTDILTMNKNELKGV